MERWHTNLRLIHEKVMHKTNNLNINNGIFQGDSLSPSLFCIALILLLYRTEIFHFNGESYTKKKEEKVSLLELTRIDLQNNHNRNKEILRH